MRGCRDAASWLVVRRVIVAGPQIPAAALTCAVAVNRLVSVVPIGDGNAQRRHLLYQLADGLVPPGRSESS